MSWAVQRRIIYFIIFFIVLATVIGGLFYLYGRHPATCFDGIQNQGETGIDCGGPCVALCADAVLSPVVLWARTFTLAPGIYSAGAYIENPNADAQAFSVPYTFSFYDSENRLLGSRSGTAFIPAGQNFALVESDVTSAMQASSSAAFSSSPVSTAFSFTAPIAWQSALTSSSDFNAIKIENLKTSFAAGAAPRVEADLANISYEDLPRIDVSAILYDASGNAIGLSKTYVDSLPKQSSSHIVFTWIRPFDGAPARVELLPVVNESPTSQL